MLDFDIAGGALDANETPSWSRFVIRPIRSDDESRLGAFYGALSPASRHRRFLAVVNELPQRLLTRFVHPDAATEVVLVAVEGNQRDAAIVGEARLVALPERPACAEFALAVADMAQRHGLGERLIRALLRRAALKGLARVYGDVLPDNRAMLGLARKLGFGERRSPGDARLVQVFTDLAHAELRSAKDSALPVWGCAPILR